MKNKSMVKKVKILGRTYQMRELSEDEDEGLKRSNGYIIYSSAEIIIEKNPLKNDKPQPTEKQKELFKKSVKRHEIIHAFWKESGLKNSSINEEWAVTALAEQLPKLFKACKKAGAL